MNIVFFKRSRPRQFQYQPRYYDPAREELEQRKRELGLGNQGDPRERFRAEMHRRWRRGQNTSPGRANLFRIIIYAIIAFLVIYLVFFTDLIKNLMLIFYGK